MTLLLHFASVLLLADPTSDVWGSRDVTAYVASVESQQKSEDPFAPAADDSAGIGRRFRLVIDSRPGTSTGTSPDGNTFFWTYDRQAQIIKFTAVADYVATREWIVDDPKFYDYAKKIGAFHTDLTEHSQSGGRRSNAYGVSVDTSLITIDTSGVMAVSPTWSIGDQYQLTTEIAAPAEEARRLASDLKLVVEGEIERLPTGRVVMCAQSYSGATIDSPTIMIENFCYAAARITRMSFQDGDGGRVVSETVPSR